MNEERKPWYKDLTEKIHAIEKNVAYMRGELDEMKRHNGKVIKVMGGIIAALVITLGTIIAAMVQAGVI